MRLSTAVHDFMLHLRMEGKARETIIAYQSDLNLLVALASVDTGDSVLAFTPELARKYLLTLSRRNLSMSTLHRRGASIREFAKWGLRRRLWPLDPTLDAPKVKRPRHLPRPFTHDEHDRIMALPLEGYELVLRGLLYYAGLRISEALSLRLQDAVLGDDDYPAELRVRGKGSKVRVVPIFPELRALLYDFFLSRAHLPVTSLIIVQGNGRPWRRQMAERRTQAWGRAAKVLECVPHRFRHTCGTHLHEAGWDIRDVQEFLGHADISTTMLYTQVTKPRLASLAKLHPLTARGSAPPPGGAA